MDGNWDGRVIEGTLLTWKDGATSALEQKSPTEFSCVLKGCTYQGKLKADGKLHWSDGDVWVRNQAAREQVPKIKQPENHSNLQKHPDILRQEREAKERAHETAMWKAGMEQCLCGAWNKPTNDGRCSKCGKDYFLGKPHMLPSSEGGGWGGPKEGNDLDPTFMLRGEARQLPEHLYQSWSDNSRFMARPEQTMIVEKRSAKQMAVSGFGDDSDSSSEEEKKKKKEKKKSTKDKKNVKKNKKGKKDKKTKKGKKVKGKKDKKGGKKKK